MADTSIRKINYLYSDKLYGYKNM